MWLRKYNHFTLYSYLFVTLYYSNITQNRIILKNRNINNIQIILEDDEGNLLDLTMNYSLSLDVHIIPNKFLQYTDAITNGN